MNKTQAIAKANQTNAPALVAINNKQFEVYADLVTATAAFEKANGFRVALYTRTAPRMAGANGWRDRGTKGGRFEETTVKVVTG